MASNTVLVKKLSIGYSALGSLGVRRSARVRTPTCAFYFMATLQRPPSLRACVTFRQFETVQHHFRMSCSMPGCSNSRRFKPEGVSFHTIPRGELKKEWLQILGKDTETWVWTKNKVVCSQHFTLEDFVSIGHQNILKMDAVPFVTSSTCVEIAEVKPLKSKEDLLQSSASTSSSSLDPLQTSSLLTGNISVQQKLEGKLCEATPDSTTSSDSSRKRREIKFLKSIHNYSKSPEKIKSKYTGLQQRLRQYQRELYKAKRKISLLQKEVISLKIVVEDLKHQNTCS